MPKKSNSLLIMFSFFALVLACLLYAAYSLLLPTAVPTKVPVLGGEMVRVYHVASQSVELLPLEEVVYRTVAGEMSASRPEQALMAQAVAARTYICRRLGAVQRHSAENADICDDYHHCQSFLSDADLHAKWGSEFEQWSAKIKSVVAATEGQVLSYQGELIDPLYHSTCGGRTEAAGSYWSTDLPCMQSVPCAWDGASKKLQSEVLFSASELAKKLGVQESDLPKLQITELSPTGRVTQVTCGQKVWDGKTLRTLLGLNSTNFNWLLLPDGSYLFVVRGYGHGVGMCQMGATGLAEQGKTYQEILTYYYTGAEITESRQ